VGTGQDRRAGLAVKRLKPRVRTHIVRPGLARRAWPPYADPAYFRVVGPWTEIPAFLLGLVTLAVTTNTFGRRSTRRLRELRTRAELLNLLPEGPGASALARHLDEAVQGLVDDLDSPRRRSGLPGFALMAIAVVAAVVWIGGASTAVVWDERPDWVRSLSLAGLVVMALCTAIMAVLNRRDAERGAWPTRTAARSQHD
jgi:hypothetical protein